MEDSCDIAIVGAGAAGLAAGIFAAEARGSTAPGRIAVLDSARKIGAKILVSGGGRCNVTHVRVRPEDFNGPRHPIRNVLAAFDEHATVAWFEAMDVPLKREQTGKLFPVSDSARTVLGALLSRCAALGVAVRPGRRVHDVTVSAGMDGARFHVHHDSGVLAAQRVVLATGGRSLPRTGSDGTGWEIVRRLGHTVTETWPALVPLVLSPGFFHAALAGVSCEVEVSTFADGRRVDRQSGSLLWTHFGVSGPVVMNASRYWVIAEGSGRTTELRVSLFPGETFEELDRRILATAAERPRLSVGRVMSATLAERLAATLATHAGVDPSRPLGQLSRDDRRRLVHTLTALVLPVERDRGWNFAEVTAGGVPLDEVDYRSMESRRARGLHLIGEMLDCDGRIGGFNFQWAWSTGYAAGRAVATGWSR